MLDSKKFDKIKESVLQYNLFNLDPGPGYYNVIDSNSINSNIRKNISKSKVTSFGSTVKRELYSDKKEYSPGPGLYYNMSKPQEKPLKLISRRKTNNDLLNIYKITKDIYKYNMGPGAYEQKSDFDIVKESYVGSHEVRFPNKVIDQPGPGKYNISKDFVSHKILFPIRKAPVKEIIRKSEDTPGVGSYRPEVLNSIQYQNLSKENLYQSIVAPFNSCSERTLNKSKSVSNIVNPGPGSYNINLYNSSFKILPEKKINKVLPLLEWKKEKEFDKGRNGPGSYINYDYNNWHKKSYNILYV